MAFDVATFAESFVAKLVDSGHESIQPHSEKDRLGFQRVVDALEGEIREMKRHDSANEPWYRELVRLRNELRASNSGAFDAFESALRDLQLSLTSSPNPYYEDITFNVSRPYARSMLKTLSPPQASVIEKAVLAFLGTRSERAAQHE